MEAPSEPQIDIPHMEDPFLDTLPESISRLNVTGSMSVSPMVARPTEAGRSPYQRPPGRQLSVRTGSKDATKGPKEEEIEDAASIAGDLNAQTRHKYVKGKFLGEGTYANVYACHLRDDPAKTFAIKRMKIGEHDQGISLSAIREVQFLQELSHPNIVRLYDVFSSREQNIHLVIELLPLGDLEGLIKDSPKPDANYEGTAYNSADIKAWMGMLGRGIWYCHENFVLHRDIKPNNLMFAPDGELKLADFGLARSIADPYQKMTSNTITRWYRPPELFYGARFYNGAVDVWSVGCVFAELFLRIPYMAGESDVNQITVIQNAIGTPTETNWPGVTSLPNFTALQPPVTRTKRDFMNLFGSAGSDGVDLLMLCLRLDPNKRCTARQFLQHRYWTSDPRPTRKEDLPKKGGGIKKMAQDLTRRGGELPSRDPVARKLDFGAKK